VKFTEGIRKIASGQQAGSFAMPCAALFARKRRMPSALLIALCGSLALLTTGFILPSAASAAQAHYYAGQNLGSPGSAAGELLLGSPIFESRSPYAPALRGPGSGLAVNEETGDVYVADTHNHRVDQFKADGAFVRAFGWGVADGSSEPQVCTTTCQAGISGAQPGQLTAPTAIAIDNDPASASHGDIYVNVGNGVTPAGEEQRVKVTGATGGTFTLTFEGQTTGPIAFDAPAESASPGSVRKALEGLSTIGAGNVYVVQDASGLYRVGFRLGALNDKDVPQITADGSALTPSSATIETSTLIEGAAEVPEAVTKFDEEGNLVEAWGEEGQLDGSALAHGPFGLVNGLAVDPVGDLWVSAGLAHYLFQFSDGGVLQQGWPEGGDPAGLTLDGSSNLYFVTGFNAITKFSPTGENFGALNGGLNQPPSTGLVINRADDDLYFDEQGGAIRRISHTCQPVEEGISHESFCLPAEEFGEGLLHQGAGLAIDSATGTLYAASTEDDRIVAFDVAVEANPEPATEVKATTATIHGEVNPEGSQLTRCRFEYGTSKSYGQSVPCAESLGAIGSGSAPVAVHADLSGLSGGTKYHFRLRARNANGDVRSDDEEFATLAIPLIDEASASEITAESATLNAEINPRGLATHYRFEYGPCETPSTCPTSPYSTSIPVPDEPIGSGTADVFRSQSITGLSPNVTYHFRVVAANANGATTGAEHTFVFLTEPAVEGSCPNQGLREANASTALPDCRAYEMVSPVKKNGSLFGGLLFGTIPPQVAENGDRMITLAIQCFADAESCVATRSAAEGEPFELLRTPNGWAPHALTLPATLFDASSVWRLNAENGSTLFSAPTLPGGQDDWYARQPDGTPFDLGQMTPSPNSIDERFESLRSLETESILTTTDLSHLVWQSKPVWPFDQTTPGGGLSLYEYVGADNTSPLMVAVSGGEGSTDLIGVCGAYVAKDRPPSAYTAMSVDGHTVYFGVQACAKGSGANAATKVPVGSLYARIDNEGPGARTVSISEPGPGQCGTGSDPAEKACRENTTDEANFRAATFAGASADGSRAYFTSTQQLTDDASQDPNATDRSGAEDGCDSTTGANGCNLYLYEDPQQQPQSGQHLIDVSAGDTSGLGPEVQGVTALSSDGSHAYFVAKGVLTETPNSQGQTATEGADNLYLYEEGHTTFIASLSASDQENWGGIGFANVTPDGRYLVFRSHRGLTPDAAPGEGAGQIYRYDAQTDELLRISIGQQGFNDNGNFAEADAGIVNALEGITEHSSPTRPDPTMSHDGRFVFFESPVALAPGALDEVHTSNPEILAENLYEWEAPGTRSCDEPSGCVSLLSDGKDIAEPSALIPSSTQLTGVDASGENVFFATASRLNWQDTDTQRDYYDARIGGGFAEPTRPIPCQGDVCKGPGTQAGAEHSPATPAFNGPEEGPNHPQKQKKGHKKKKKSHRHSKHKAKKRANANRGGQK